MEKNQIVDDLSKLIIDYDPMNPKHNSKEVIKWFEERNEWAREDRKLEIVDDIFTKLQKIDNALKSSPDDLEFVLGNALLTSTNQTVKYPLIYKSCSIKFLPESNSFQVCTDLDSVKFSDELSYSSKSSFLSKLNWQKLADFKRDIELLDFIILDDKMKSKIENIGHELDSSIHVYTNENDVEYFTDTQGYITLEPVLILRKARSSNLMFLDHVEEALESNKLIGNLIDIIVGQSSKTNNNDIELRSDWGAINGQAQDIYFTKPANREQLQIVDYIESNDAVVVQGPPGTGKTHTIANLIGHYLSEGKSILVTSSTSKALNVLRDKLPHGIRPLCVPLLDGGQAELAKSIGVVSEQLQLHDNAQSKLEIEKLIELYKCQYNDLEKLREDVFLVKRKENQYLSIQGKSYSFNELAKYIVNNISGFEYFNELKADSHFPIDKEDYKFLLNYLENVYSYITDDQIEIQQSGLSLDQVINSENLKLLEDEWNCIQVEIKNIVNNLSRILQNKLSYKLDEHQILLLFDGMELNDSLLISSIDLIDNRFNFEDDYYYELAGNRLAQVEDEIEWNELDTLLVEGEAIFNLYKNAGLSEAQILVDGDELSYKSLPAILEIKDMLENPPGIIGRIFRGIKIEDICRRITINGENIKGLDECKKVLAVINYDKWKYKFESKWNYLIGNYIEEYSFENILKYTNGRNISAWCRSNVLEKIENSKSWYSNTIEALALLWGKNGIRLQINDNPLNTPGDRIKCLDEYLDKLKNSFQKYKDLKNIKYIEWQEASTSNLSIMSNLAQTTGNRFVCRLYHLMKINDIAKYDNLYKQICFALRYLSDTNRYLSIIEHIKSVASEWGKLIEEKEWPESDRLSYEEICDIWFNKQCMNVYHSIVAIDLPKLTKRIDLLSKQLLETAHEIVVNKAWYERARFVSKNKAVHAALGNWVSLMKKIGKGTGRSAPKYRKQALQQLAIAKDAIPCWIMPINKVFNTIDPNTMTFDLIIVDEASQADINALPILALGKKAIVVGDDKQVSPSAPAKIDDEAIHKLQLNYLSKFNNYFLYDFKTSFYEFVRPLSKQVMLKEHFRCVSTIINYCNFYFYDNQINPLRDDSLSPLKTPIIPIYVKGYRDRGGPKTNQTSNKKNKEEAEYIVSLIQACFNNPAYDDLSFGVISMLGNQQSEYIYKLLIEKCSPSDIKKHQVICGDAAQFQGDERDVIFLSLVDAHDVSEKNSMIRRIDKSNLIFAQRYNVAVSRAKNQLWVLHSMTLEELRNDDIRNSLLRYCKDYNSQERLIEISAQQSESPFEQEVVEYLIRNSYIVRQQYPVGNYRLDIVVEDGDRKVAVECDGEAYHSTEEQLKSDFERQTILERIGWQFIRIRGSQFYKNRSETFEYLIQELEKKSIRPSCNHSNIIEVDAVVEEIKREASYIRSKNKDESPIAHNHEERSVEIGINPTDLEPGNGTTFSGRMEEDAENDSDKSQEISQNSDNLFDVMREARDDTNSSELLSNLTSYDDNIKKCEDSDSENKVFFGDLGYVSVSEYRELRAQVYKIISGQQKNSFNQNQINKGILVYHAKYGIGVIDYNNGRTIRVVFSEKNNNKSEIFISPECFKKKILIILQGQVH